MSERANERRKLSYKKANAHFEYIFKYTCKLCNSLCDEHYSLHVGCWDHWAMSFAHQNNVENQNAFLESTNLWAKHELLMYCTARQPLWTHGYRNANKMCSQSKWNNRRWRFFTFNWISLVFSVNFFVCGKFTHGLMAIILLALIAFVALLWIALLGRFWVKQRVREWKCMPADVDQL